MQKLKGIKVIRNKRGKAKQLVIDIDKHYDVVEDLVDIIEAESRMNEKGYLAEDVFKEIEERKKKPRRFTP